MGNEIPEGWTKEELDYANSLVEQFTIKDQKKAIVDSLKQQNEEDEF